MFDLRAYLQQHATVQTKFNDDTEWVIQCSCDKDKGSREWHLWVNVDKQRGFCYRCKKKLGDIVDIVRYIEGLTYSEAVARVQDATSSTERLTGAIRKLFPDLSARKPDEESTRIELPAEFISAWRRKKLPAYFTSRGLTKEICDLYNLGYCKKGFFANRVIVPVFDENEELATFVARYMAQKPPQGVKKILYPKGSRASKVLFNYHEAKKHKTVVVTEGVFDAIRVGLQAVATLGKNPSRMHVKRLVELGATRRLVVLLDRDATEEAIELVEELSELCPDVRLAQLPKGRKDPGDCQPVEIDRAIKKAISLDDRNHRLANILAGL